MIQTTSNFDATVLCKLFQTLFGADHNAQLLGGAEEPLYQPGGNGKPNIIYFTRDYFASALHEVAHWCIAGRERRQLTDYGYWYKPDGRNSEQQRQFEQVEVQPQALEWVFCVATGYPFRISADNLNGDVKVSPAFKQRIWQQARAYSRDGMPARGQQFAEGLRARFGGADFFDRGLYKLEDLR